MFNTVSAVSMQVIARVENKSSAWDKR